MIPRYSRPEMARIWEERAKMEKWLLVELAVCDVLAERGEIPEAAHREIRARARFDPARVAELEKKLRHDVVAFLENLSENVGESARYIHAGLTSSDVLDTGLALQLAEAADLILGDLQRLREALKRRAFEHKLTPIAGRTHGMGAEPMSLGHKLALWYDEVGRHVARVERARECVRVGKISGAVGNYAHLPPEVEEEVCRRLGLRPAPASSQIVQRDRHAEYVLTLALIAATVAKVATELRHLQRSEVREAEEPFGEEQKGSSAMPHKRNPVTAEQLCGLARVVQSYATAALENVPLWHERDISHSSVERIILPDSSLLVDYMLAKLTELIEGWVVRPERMRENLEAGGGLLFSQQVLLALIRKGMSREAAYRIVQGAAMRAWEGGENFRALLEQDAEVARRLPREELESCFRLDPYLRHVGRIFARVFGEGG